MSDHKAIAVIGAGSWGTALAIQFARLGHGVRLWGHDPEHLQAIKTSGFNQTYLPDIKLPQGIITEKSLAKAVANVSHILIVIPSKAFREFLKKLKYVVNPGTKIFWASKGFEIETGKFLHQIVEEELPGLEYGVISGPTFAREVALGLPAALTCAGNNQQSTAEFASLLHGERFRCYTSDDVIGVEVGGALKNVLAIAVGVADGLGFGANSRSALMTRGMSEVMRFGETLGAKRETLMGLAGLGDLILTCTDNQSRNRRFGLAIGKGSTAAEAETEIGQTVEGLRAAEAIYLMAQKHQLDLPIMEQVYQVLYQNKPALEAVSSLEQRPQSAEL